MKTCHLVWLALVGMGLFGLALETPANADKNDGKETCASKYPNAPTQPPRGYDYKNETDAYMAFRRTAVEAGYTAVKKVARRLATRGPCVGHGEHINMKGTRPVSKGKKPDWRQIGSMTSCQICEETSRGPRLYRTLWRIHPDF